VKEYAKNNKEFFSIHPDGKFAHHYEERGLKVTSSNGLSMYVQKGNVIVIEDSLQTIMAD
jgi:ribose 1,5-bisphosphokinase PhnN